MENPANSAGRRLQLQGLSEPPACRRLLYSSKFYFGVFFAPRLRVGAKV